MALKMEKWKHTNDRFVAFLDIMGFKDRLLREGQEKVGIMLKSLRPTIADIKRRKQVFYAEVKKTLNKNTIKDDLSSLVYPVTFSDSIILFSKDKSDDSAIEIIVSAATIISKALKKEIPIKGAIAFGEMTVYKTSLLYFGTPLIDAFELQNDIHLYGVILHHTLENHLYELKIIENYEKWGFICKYIIPMKSGKILHYIVNLALFSEKIEDVLNSVTKLYNSVSGSPRLYVDNTIQFLDYLEKEKAKKKSKS